MAHCNPNPNPRYTSVSYMGMPGFNTVLKPGLFSLTQNERDRGAISLPPSREDR